MQRSSLHLRTSAVTVGLCLVGLLSGCGETTPQVSTPETESTLPPVTLNMAGTWKDEGARYEICDYVEPNLEVYMQLEQATGQDTFSGPLVMGIDNGTEHGFVGGTTSGSVSGGKLTGTASVVNSLGDTLTFDMALSPSESRLTGRLLGKEPFPCDFYETPMLGDDTIVIEVDLQRTDEALPRGVAPQEPVEDDALEPNNDKDEAAEIELDYEATLVLQDEDWFKLTLSEEQLLTLGIQADDASHFYVDANFYNEAREVVYNADFYDSSYSAQTEVARFEAGVYYLELSGYVESETQSYTLNLSSQGLPDAAFEPNNTAQSATPLTLGAPARTMYLADGDEDWFSFTLDTAQSVTFDLKNGEDGFSYVILDDELNHRNNGYSNQALTMTLTAGHYYLGVHHSYSATLYSVHVSGEDIPDSAFEPNDSASTAAEIEADFSGEMYLMQEDEDWFSFNLKETQLVTFNLGDNYYYLAATLYDADLDVYRSGDYNEPFTLALETGTYYLRVYNEYGYYDDLNYSLEISGAPIPDKEFEPNDSFNTASAVQLPFSADLYMAKGEEDWFKFTLSEEQLVTLERSDDGYYDLDGAFYKEDGTQVEGHTFSLASSSAVSFILPADTYVVSLSDGYYYGDRDFTYSLSVTSEDIPDLEYEPNNSRSEAHTVTLGFSDNDLLVSRGDDDWFRFTLSQATQVNITLEGGEYDHPSVTLRDTNGRHMRGLSSGSNSLVLSKGTYYLEVDGYYGGAKKYGLSIHKK